MQSGIMGTVQKSLLKAQDHIFFERSELKDRLLVVNRYNYEKLNLKMMQD